MTLEFRLRHRFPAAAPARTPAGAGPGVTLDIAFTVPGPGVTVLFGPSGAGKSSVIAATAGLLRPDACRIAVGDRILADTETGIWLPPEHRRVGLVFQDARLFPHMSVETNLRFGLRRAPPGDIRFEEVVALLGLAPLLRRRPRGLSGGERQRVAIGRALLAQPMLLLMDEPLAGLDAARKAEILPFLTRLKTALRLPVLYVTHAPEEVNALADFLVLIEAGRVAGYGSLSEVASRTDLPFARRDDAGAVLECRVGEHDAARRLTRLEGGGATLFVPLMDLPVGGACRARIPAREVILARVAPEGISLHNIIPGTVRRIAQETARHSVMVEIALAGGRASVGVPHGGAPLDDASTDDVPHGGVLLGRVTPDAVARLGLVPGGPVLALIKSTSIEVLDVSGRAAETPGRAAETR